MKESKYFNTNTYLRLLLIVPAIALLGLTACSTAGGTAKGNNRRQLCRYSSARL